jgi:chitin disaccharide deacetylase
MPLILGVTARRHIWLCADDYGMSHAVNVAIRDLVVRGRINATSVMVVAPNFYRSEALSQHPQ